MYQSLIPDKLPCWYPACRPHLLHTTWPCTSSGLVCFKITSLKRSALTSSILHLRRISFNVICGKRSMNSVSWHLTYFDWIGGGASFRLRTHLYNMRDSVQLYLKDNCLMQKISHVYKSLYNNTISPKNIKSGIAYFQMYAYLYASKLVLFLSQNFSGMIYAVSPNWTWRYHKWRSPQDFMYILNCSTLN